MTDMSQSCFLKCSEFLPDKSARAIVCPDPVFIFIYVSWSVIAIGVIAAHRCLRPLRPTCWSMLAGNAVVVSAESLLPADNIRRLLVEMPATFAGFHPGLCAGGDARRGRRRAPRACLPLPASGAVSRAPRFLPTPAVALIGMLGNLAADAAYVVLIPLAGVIFAAAGPTSPASPRRLPVSRAIPGESVARSAGCPAVWHHRSGSGNNPAESWDANIAGNAVFRHRHDLSCFCQ